MGEFFYNVSMTMAFHILNVLYDLESHAKDGRCGLSRNEDIRRYVDKLVEKQTLDPFVGELFIYRHFSSNLCLLAVGCSHVICIFIYTLT